MLALREHGATPEQLPIISGTRLGVEVIRGAAGSGKTSTALLRLEALAHTFSARRMRIASVREVRILVLTFNRTLAGYVEHLAESQIAHMADVKCEVKTFASWSFSLLNRPNVIDTPDSEAIIRGLCAGIPLDPEFLISEIDYVCGRFSVADRANYLTTERAGRGASPAVPRIIRPQILNVIEGYERILQARGLIDWHGLADGMLVRPSVGYDIVIVDEAQDFSANQLRAVAHHLSDPYCLTLVLDTAQRLYPRGFTWSETGINMAGAVYHRLRENHRNTIEIATFARGLIDGIGLDDDGTLPDFSAATRHGGLPIVCVGNYQSQVDFALDWIINNVNLAEETIAFLKPKGGRWFKTLAAGLLDRGIPFVTLTRDRDWPEGPENVAISTMHSAKGLEFDHVVILGLSDQVAPLHDEPTDDSSITCRRLIAMAAGRARKSLMVGYKEGEESGIVRHFAPGTFIRNSL